MRVVRRVYPNCLVQKQKERQYTEPVREDEIKVRDIYIEKLRNTEARRKSEMNSRPTSLSLVS